MGQSRWGSLFESFVNVAIGFLVGFAANVIVLPAFGYPVTLGDAAWISVAFTVISLVRGYFVRRLFNRFHLRSSNPQN